jgi:hypothetical protein
VAKKNYSTRSITSITIKCFVCAKDILCGDTALASDATQEIFIKVWEKLDTFRNEPVSALGFTELQ